MGDNIQPFVGTIENEASVPGVGTGDMVGSVHRMLRPLFEKVRRKVEAVGGLAGRLLPVVALAVVGQLAFATAPAQAQSQRPNYIFNTFLNKCIVGTAYQGMSRGARVALASCNPARAPARSEAWVILPTGQIRLPGLDRCLDVLGSLRIQLWDCKDQSRIANQIWYQTSQQWIVYRQSQECLDVSDSALRLADCEDPSNFPNTDQRWVFIAR